MNMTLQKIERIFNNNNAKNTILKPVMWRIYLYAVLMGLLGVVLFYWFIVHNTITSFFLAFSPIMFVLLLFWFDINRYAKNQLRNQGIKVENNFLKHWSSEDYKKKKHDNIFKDMKEEGILPKDNTKSIFLLEKYSKSYKEISSQKPLETIFKSIGGTAILFIIPFWNSFLGTILHKESTFEDLKLAFGCLLLIISQIVLYHGLIKEALNEILYRQHERWKYISEVLLSIKSDLELEKEMEKGDFED